MLSELKQGVYQKHQSEYHQTWMFATATAVYFKVQDLATPEQDARIKWWMSQVVKHVKFPWDRNLDYKNNHYVWTAVGVMQYGVLANSKDDIDWARSAFKYYMGQVRSDGFLATEIYRGKKALYYHNYALQPVVYMAKLSQLIGENWMAD